METHEGLHPIATLVALRVQRFTVLSGQKVDKVTASERIVSISSKLGSDRHIAAGPDRDLALLQH